MASVVPTVLATSPQEYQKMIERASSLSSRVHVDICDGKFADNKTINLSQVYANEGIKLDLHLMLESPEEQIETALSLHPELIIFHAESGGKISALIGHCQELGVKAGVALLPATAPESQKDLIKKADHALIFTGTLGHNAGQFQASELEKVAAIRTINPDIEVSVDGGVTDETASQTASSGVDVLYVGSFIQDAEDAKSAYDRLNEQVAA